MFFPCFLQGCVLFMCMLTYGTCYYIMCYWDRVLWQQQRKGRKHLLVYYSHTNGRCSDDCARAKRGNKKLVIQAVPLINNTFFLYYCVNAWSHQKSEAILGRAWSIPRLKSQMNVESVAAGQKVFWHRIVCYCYDPMILSRGKREIPRNQYVKWK